MKQENECTNECTKALWQELKSANPTPEKIRELVKQGADVSGGFLIDAIWTLVPRRNDDGTLEGVFPDLKLFETIIECGGDVNYREDMNDFNCLYDAALMWFPELVELFLKAGANPNIISMDEHQSLLSWAEFDLYYENFEKENNGVSGVEYMEVIVELLKKYGAKYTNELNADKTEGEHDKAI